MSSTPHQHLQPTAGDDSGARSVPPEAAERITGRLPQPIVDRVMVLVEERLSEAIHVEDLARAVGLSPFHFSRMFHAAVGKPPHAFITSRRMEAAKRLLGETQTPIAEVARQVGYRTQAHFTGVFHRHVGTTPRAFRRQAREVRWNQ
jgi:AraC family transcriptional regulator